MYERKIFNSSLTVNPQFLHGNTSSSSRSTANRILSSIFSGRYFQEDIDQIRASNPFKVANIIFHLTCHHSLIQTSSLRTLPLQSPVIFRHSLFMINFMIRTASFPKSIGVVDSCLSAVNSRKKIDEYLRLNFYESCFFFIPCIKISY